MLASLDGAEGDVLGLGAVTVDALFLKNLEDRLAALITEMVGEESPIANQYSESRPSHQLSSRRVHYLSRRKAGSESSARTAGWNRICYLESTIGASLTISQIIHKN
jgi:hypothetical protein